MTLAQRLSGLLAGAHVADRGKRVAGMIFAGLLTAAIATAGVWAAFQAASPAGPQLTAMLPQGALLTIEAKDFAGLLKQWNESPEKAAWVKSDNYSVFSRSRLFGRLGDAQGEFAQAAGLPADMSFLNEVAGGESVFAWYDIGNLEFLYITRMSQGSVDKTRLVQMRGKFAPRQVGDLTFYVRTQADENQGGRPRTVAFATRGDLLLLATREDLMAGALMLIANAAANTTAIHSVAEEPWFVDARAVAGKEPGALRMILNLEKIVPTPYFRSYWAQQNITEMKQYRSAITDLYTSADVFREERVLLLKSAPDNVIATTNLTALTALLPQHAGVYRAIAAPDVNTAVEGVDEKLLERGTGTFADARLAPEADVSVHEAGSATDLETRIDAAPLAHPVKGVELAPLRQVLAASDLQAMMTVSRTNDPVDGIWVPFQSAVVLSAAKNWDVTAMQGALEQAMQAHLTAGGLGLAWRPVKAKEGTYFTISEARPLAMAAEGNLCILADDPGLMMEILSHVSGEGQNRKRGRKTSGKSAVKPDASLSRASMIAGFDLAQERSTFTRWTGLVDRTNTAPASQSGGDGNGEAPSFFSQNMRSLGEVFAPLESERMVEQRDGALTRQTVTYAWRH